MNNKGFTLFELVIVVGLFVFVSGMMLVNFKQGNEVEELRQSANLMATYIGEARNKAITGYDAENAQGYGVIYALSNRHYFRIYTDEKKSDQIGYDGDGSDPSQTITLLSDVVITGTGLEFMPLVQYDTLFQIPGGAHLVNGSPDVVKQDITLYSATAERYIDISIWFATGQISVGRVYE